MREEESREGGRRKAGREEGSREGGREGEGGGGGREGRVREGGGCEVCVRVYAVEALTIPFSSRYQKVAESSVVNFSAKCFPFCTVSGNSTSTPSPGRGLSSW